MPLLHFHGIIEGSFGSLNHSISYYRRLTHLMRCLGCVVVVPGIHMCAGQCGCQSHCRCWRENTQPGMMSHGLVPTTRASKNNKNAGTCLIQPTHTAGSVAHLANCYPCDSDANNSDVRQCWCSHTSSKKKHACCVVKCRIAHIIQLTFVPSTH